MRQGNACHRLIDPAFQNRFLTNRAAQAARFCFGCARKRASYLLVKLAQEETIRMERPVMVRYLSR
jgi:hypothetical protein